MVRRLSFVDTQTRIVHVELLDGLSTLVLIPRIRFKTKVGSNGIAFSRLQLPLRVSYALAIVLSELQIAH